MLIRSQDKLQLINLENGTTAVDYRNKKNILFYDTGSTEATSTLGNYSSEEKAVEVMDMIQEFYDKCMAFNMGEDGCYHEASEKKTFQMPQDDEVEV